MLGAHRRTRTAALSRRARGPRPVRFRSAGDKEAQEQFRGSPEYRSIAGARRRGYWVSLSSTILDAAQQKVRMTALLSQTCRCCRTKQLDESAIDANSTYFGDELGDFGGDNFFNDSIQIGQSPDREDDPHGVYTAQGSPVSSFPSMYSETYQTSQSSQSQTYSQVCHKVAS